MKNGLIAVAIFAILVIGLLVAVSVHPTSPVPQPSPAPRFYYSSSSSYTSLIMTPQFSITHDASTVVYPDASAWLADTKTTNWNAAPLMNGTVGYWPLDEGAGASAYDLSGNNNVGALTGISWVSGSDCKFGACVQFSNSISSYLTITAISAYDSASWTLCLWVNFTGYDTAAGLWSSSGVYPRQFAIPNLIQDGTFSWYPSGVAMGENDLSDDCITYASGITSLFLNGTLQDSTTMLTMNNGPFGGGFGRFGEGQGNIYTISGQIDNIQLYNCALTSTEIMENYLSSFPVLEQNPPTGTFIYLYDYWYQISASLNVGQQYSNFGTTYTASVAGIYWIDSVPSNGYTRYEATVS